MWRVYGDYCCRDEGIDLANAHPHTIKPTKQGSREDQDQMLNEAQLVMGIVIAYHGTRVPIGLFLSKAHSIAPASSRYEAR